MAKSRPDGGRSQLCLQSGPEATCLLWVLAGAALCLATPAEAQRSTPERIPGAAVERTPIPTRSGYSTPAGSFHSGGSWRGSSTIS